MELDLRSLGKLWPVFVRAFPVLAVLASLLVAVWQLGPKIASAAAMEPTATRSPTVQPRPTLVTLIPPTIAHTPEPTTTPIASGGGSEETEMLSIPTAESIPLCQHCEPTGLPVGLQPGKGPNEPVYLTCRYRDENAPQHGGLDFAAPAFTEITAAHDGVVTFAGYERKYGNLVVVENTHWVTRYAHASYLLARVGDTVHAGDVLALVGSTGQSTGPHLHYEIGDTAGNRYDPETYLYLFTGLLRDAPCKAAP